MDNVINDYGLKDWGIGRPGMFDLDVLVRLYLINNLTWFEPLFSNFPIGGWIQLAPIKVIPVLLIA